MKKLLSLTAIIAFAISSIQAAEPSARLDELRVERRELRRAISKAVPNPNARDPELAQLQRASLEAMKAFEGALAEYPALAEFNEQLKAANARLAKAIADRDDIAKQAAQDELSAIQHRRLEAAMKDPKIQSLSKANQQAGDAWRARNDELLASLPETKDLVKRMNEVNAEISEQMKKSQR